MSRSRMHVPMYAGRLTLAVGIAAMFACSEQPTTPTGVAPSPTGAPSLSSAAERSPALKLASVEWQDTARALIARRRSSPIVAARSYALLGVAQYGAVVAVNDGENDDEGNGTGGLTSFAQRGAVAGASARVLSYVFPADAAALEQRVTTEASAGSARAMRQFARGVAVGRRIGDAMLVWAKKDGYAMLDGTPVIWDPASLRSGPGIWAMDDDVAPPVVPAGFQFPVMHAYFLKTPDQFHPPKPPTDLTGPVNEVILAVANRTPELADSARRWNLPAGTMTPVGYWDVQATAFIAESRMDERAAAHVFALVNSAAMDAVTGCWEAKYSYLVPRPWMVRPDAFPRVGTVLILGRPNHPSYPSGHSCVSAAAAEVLNALFRGKTAMLNKQVLEAGQSRVNAGIHYQFDIDAGQKLGRAVAQWALTYDRRRGLLAAVGLGEGKEEHGEH